MVVDIMKCKHCDDAEANRPRGLCWSCYYKPGVRECYPSGGHLGTGQREPRSPAKKPTRHRPGTPEKIEVMRERANLRQELYHEDDAKA